MWFNKQLVLLQGKAGYKPGDKEWDFKGVTVKFQAAYLTNASPPAGAGLYEFLGTMAEYPIMGRYSIVANDTGHPNSSYVIGRYANPKNKVWRYNPDTLTLEFGTLEEWTGTAESKGEHTFNITNDLELYNVFLTVNGFVVRGGGYHGYGQGRVNIASYTHLPFEARVLFWHSL